MVYSNSSQRDVYKLVEKFTEGNYKSDLVFLKSLVKELVNHHEFEIIGGRVWELNPQEKVYELRYQIGSLKKIPNNYKVSLEDYPVFSELVNNRTSLHQETDDFLRQKGIEVYSVTALGEIVKIDNHRYYKWVLGFNAEHILQSFFETLNIISSVASVRIRDMQYKEERKKLQRDINKASEIQRNLLPQHNLEFHDYSIFGACIPDSEVGGDYFDYFKNHSDEEERVGIVISDAASKGLPAAIQALFVSGAIRMGLSFSPKISALLNRLNSLIYETFPFERFVTLFYCELTTSSNRLVLYANAGHCSPIHFSYFKNEFSFLKPTGGLLGILENQTYQIENLSMKHNDILVLYTDGISEAQDKDGNQYGEQRICDTIRKYKDETAKNIAYMIIEDVQKFSANSIYNDDKTIVVVKREIKSEID